MPKSLPIVTTHQAVQELSERGFTNLHGMSTWEPLRLYKGNVYGEAVSVRLTAMPARHGPRLVDFALPDVMGTLIELEHSSGPEPYRIYVTGDTVMFDGLREIAARVPSIDLMLVHLGGTRVLGVTVTMDGKQGLELIELLRPALTVPVHFDDYDVFKSPLSDFQERVERQGLDHIVKVLERGRSLQLPAMPARSAYQPHGH